MRFKKQFIIYSLLIGLLVLLGSYLSIKYIQKNRTVVPCVCQEISKNIPPSIKLFIDNSFEWETGSIHLIRWKKSCNVNYINLKVKQPDGKLIVAEDLPVCDSAFLFKVPATHAQQIVLSITGSKQNEKEPAIDSDAVETKPGDTSQYAWEELTKNAAFYERDGAGTIAINGSLFLFGGWNPYKDHQTTNEIWRSQNGHDWELVGYAPWERRHTFGRALFKGEFWIIGGDCIQGHYQNDIWKTKDGIHWQKVLDSIPWTPRQNFGVRVYNGKLWLFGGELINYTIAEEPSEFNDVWCSEDGIHWNNVSPTSPWSPRAHLGSIVKEQKSLCVLGGADYNKRTVAYREIWTSLDGKNWALHDNMPWLSKRYMNLIDFDGKIWIVAGASVDQVNTNEVWYSKDCYNWYLLENVPFPPRHATSLAEFNHSVVMAAGYLQNDVWALKKLN